MLLVKIVSDADPTITSFEIGTLDQYEKRRAEDPQWKFVDRNHAELQSDLPGFLKNPTDYKLNKYGHLKKK